MLDLIIKAAMAAAKESAEREKSQVDRLRQENDARYAAEWAFQQAMDERNARAAAVAKPPPMPLKKKPPPLLRQRVQGQAAVARGDATQAASASAKTIATWAQPRTLRSQFILTEVLKPPLSMRKPV